MARTIVVVDYHKGNLKSVERGLVAAGGDVVVSDDARIIARADAVVLPGVGSFADASASMRTHAQMDAVRDRIVSGVAFLGICLGQHLMFEKGVEGVPQQGDSSCQDSASGLGILSGVVTKIAPHDAGGRPCKVPHVGWNTVEAIGEEALEACPLFAGIASGTYFYFTHSYITPAGPFVVAQTTHGAAFPSAVRYGDVAFGVQFHPEKSSDAGATLLRNFVHLVKGA